MTSMTATQAAQAMIDFGLADDMNDAIAQLEDMGEIDAVTDERTEA